jgi:hypothetical protein
MSSKLRGSGRDPNDGVRLRSSILCRGARRWLILCGDLKTLLVSHAVVTWFLCGLIWTIQLVHYPSFADVGRDAFAAFHQAHLQRITLLVALPMVLELVSGGVIVLVAPVPRGSAVLGLVLLAIIWGATALVQVPLHDALARGGDGATITRLIDTNWVRTAAWTLRGVLVGWWVFARP